MMLRSEKLGFFVEELPHPAEKTLHYQKGYWTLHTHMFYIIHIIIIIVI